jgi:hypothetical protein
MVLCLEKELRYDNPGRHDLNSRRSGSMIHLIECKPVQGRPAKLRPTRGARRYLSARAYFFGATRKRSRAASPFCMPVACYHGMLL